MYLRSLCLIFLILVLEQVTCQKVPHVNIPLGKVEGFLDKTVNGRTFYSFEGIPYARPPVGKYRFREPVPPKPWEGIWKANTKFECLQYNHFPRLKSDPVDGAEDCLYVNVHTPKIKGNLDVIVFIHGGAFIFGSGAEYEPHILLDRDVVFVTLNYRLGPLGFLSTEDDVVPGNNGLKDQIMALKWIKDNIKFFGGNPDSITISGMSAGGASVHFHTLSKKSKGLFNRAISQSGCMLNSWVLMENPLERAKELSAYVGCNIDNTESMIHCLRKKPGKQIVSAVRKFQPWKYNPFSPFGVVVDEWASDPLIPKHPLQLLKEGSVTDLPWMVSHTTGEGLYPAFEFYSEDILDYIDKHWNEVMPHILHYNFTIENSQMDEISSRIRREYFGKEPVSKKNFKKLVDVIGDRLFIADLEKCTRLHAAAVRAPVFHYIFDYRGAHSWSEVGDLTTENIGVSHGDDTIYVIKTEVDSLSTEEDRAISKFMLDLFVSFARTGIPKSGVEWSEVSKNVDDSVRYLRIAKSFTEETSDNLGNREFWNSLPFEENENLFSSIKDEL